MPSATADEGRSDPLRDPQGVPGDDAARRTSSPRAGPGAEVFPRTFPERAVGGGLDIRSYPGGLAVSGHRLDTFSRRIVGYAIASRQSTEPMVTALRRAVNGRRPSARLIHHSDQESQYTSHDFQRQCAAYGICQSMGSVGDCYDNTMAGSFFATLKWEWVGIRTYASVVEVRASLCEYIDGFYNSRQMHPSIGYANPNEFERKIAAQPD